MPKQVISVEIENSGYELTKAIAAVVGSVKIAMADGWQTGMDLPVVITSAIGQLATLASAVPNIGPDAKEDTVEFIKGINLGAYDIASIFIKK